MEKSLKQRAITGAVWNFADRFGTSILLFAANMIFARLLTPTDFGQIGILMVFISLSLAITDSGFNAALIQRKDITDRDLSTVLIWNVGLSLFLYGVIYFCSPYVANFYNEPLLINTLRALALMLIMNALFAVPTTIYKKHLEFKKLARINLLATFIGSCVGIAAAFYDYGIWSLVIKYLATALLQVILSWANFKWRPKLIFDKESFKGLFKFGSFIFITTLVNSAYINILNLLIGKAYSTATLGYFTQAKKLENLSRTTLSSVLNNVSFSLFSKLQDDRAKFRLGASKGMRMMAYFNVALMLLLIVIAEPLISILYSDKWIESVPYFQLLCLHGLIFSFYEYNSQLLKSVGKSKKYFYIKLFQCLFTLTLVVCFIKQGIYYVIGAYLVGTYISYLVNGYVAGKTFGYGLWNQIKDIYKVLIASIISAVAAYSIDFLELNMINFVELLVKSTIFVVCYLLLSKIMKLDAIKEIKNKFLKK